MKTHMEYNVLRHLPLQAEFKEHQLDIKTIFKRYYFNAELEILLKK